MCFPLNVTLHLHLQINICSFEKTEIFLKVLSLDVLLYTHLQINYILLHVNKLGEKENTQYKWLPAS